MFIFPLIVVMILLQSVGCKKGNPEGRENVSGTITLNDKAIDSKWTAAISFIPSDGRDATDGGGGQILQGKYMLTGVNAWEVFWQNLYYTIAL